MKEDSAVLYEELLKGLDKVKAKTQIEANKKMEAKKKSNGKIQKIEIRNDFEHNLEKNSSENETEDINFNPEDIIENAPSNNIKTQNNNLLIQDYAIKKSSGIKDQKPQKSFWENLYIAGASVMFALACFVVSLFVLTFSFLFHRHMMQIASDPLRLESFLSNIWMAFSGGAIFIFFYFAGYFIKNKYKNTEKDQS